MSIFLGILAFVASNQLPGGIIFGIVYLSFGLLYLALGFFVQRKSKLALGIAVGFMVISLLSGIYSTIQTGKPFGLIIPTAFLSQAWEGFEAIKVLKSKT